MDALKGEAPLVGEVEQHCGIPLRASEGTLLWQTQGLCTISPCSAPLHCTRAAAVTQ